MSGKWEVLDVKSSGATWWMVKVQTPTGRIDTRHLPKSAYRDELAVFMCYAKLNDWDEENVVTSMKEWLDG